MSKKKRKLRRRNIKIVGTKDAPNDTQVNDFLDDLVIDGIIPVDSKKNVLVTRGKEFTILLKNLPLLNIGTIDLIQQIHAKWPYKFKSITSVV